MARRRPVGTTRIALGGLLVAAGAAMMLVPDGDRGSAGPEGAATLDRPPGYVVPTATAPATLRAEVLVSEPAATVMLVADAGRPVAPGLPRQLTTDSCCAGAWWVEDSSALCYIDRQMGAPLAGVYEVPLWPPGSRARAVDTTLTGEVAGRYLIRPSGGDSEVEDLESGERWTLPTEGSPVIVSPDGGTVVWWTASGGEEYLTSLVRIFASAIDGSGVRELAGLWRANVMGFHPDSRRILIAGRPVRESAQYVLAMLDTSSGEMKQLARGSWLSDAVLSPSGDWVVYMVSLDKGDPSANGIWVVPSAGGEARRLDFVGAYRWRDGDRLVLVPMTPGQAYHSVWELDVRNWQMRLLLDPAEVPLRIADNDWSISPDGYTMAFVSEDDRNIWIVDLP